MGYPCCHQWERNERVTQTDDIKDRRPGGPSEINPVRNTGLFRLSMGNFPYSFPGALEMTPDACSRLKRAMFSVGSWSVRDTQGPENTQGDRGMDWLGWGPAGGEVQSQTSALSLCKNSLFPFWFISLCAFCSQCIYSALRKYSATLNFVTFCHISGFKHKDIKLYFFVKNQQQVGHNHEVERHLLDISNLQNYSAPLLSVQQTLSRSSVRSSEWSNVGLND